VTVLANQSILSLPALRGHMGSRSYYVVLLPLTQVARLLEVPNGDEFSPEARSQRKLVQTRIPEIAAYILDNEEDWLFSSLTASFDADVNFIPGENSDAGVLQLPLESRLLVNDGQHRRAAIERALKTDPTIGKQTISVVLFPAESLERNQQMFSDLNRTAQKTSRSLNIMYDHRDSLNEIATSLETHVPLLAGRVEKESQSIAVRSSKLITLSALYDMCREAIGADKLPLTSRDEIDGAERRLVDDWISLTNVLPQWRAIEQGDLRPAEARAEFVNVHSVFFFAIGGVLNQIADVEAPQLALNALRDVDWRRSNSEWQGICMLGPDIITRRQTRQVLREYLLWRVGLRDEQPKPAFST
jgi:DNA sulfur modification protein DndB